MKNPPYGGFFTLTTLFTLPCKFVDLFIAVEIVWEGVVVVMMAYFLDLVAVGADCVVVAVGVIVIMIMSWIAASLIAFVPRNDGVIGMTIVVIGMTAMIASDVAVDGSDFVDESELFKEFHRSIDGGDIDGIVTDFCYVVGIEWFGGLRNDVNDDLTGFGDFVSMLGEEVGDGSLEGHED